MIAPRRLWEREQCAHQFQAALQIHVIGLRKALQNSARRVFFSFKVNSVEKFRVFEQYMYFERHDDGEVACVREADVGKQ